MPRISDDTLNEAIVVIDTNRPSKAAFVDQVTGEVGYGIGAKKVQVQVEVGHDSQRRKEDNPECYCKFVVVNGDTVFYIKTDMHENFANPWATMVSHGESARFAKRTGRPAWKFVRVQKECFEFYLKFLDTRNQQYYRTCERMHKNG